MPSSAWRTVEPYPITITNVEGARDILTGDRATQFHALISIGDTDLSGDRTSETPPGFDDFGIDDDREKLRLYVNDTRPVAGDYELDEYLRERGPAPRHVRQLLDFFPKIKGPLLVHCHAGWSRSPAVALLYLAWCLGRGREAAAVRRLREIKPTVIPNEALVALGDQLMGFERRLFDAELRHSGMDKYEELRAVYDVLRKTHHGDAP